MARHAVGGHAFGVQLGEIDALQHCAALRIGRLVKVVGFFG